MVEGRFLISRTAVWFLIPSAPLDSLAGPADQRSMGAAAVPSHERSAPAKTRARSARKRIGFAARVTGYRPRDPWAGRTGSPSQ